MGAETRIAAVLAVLAVLAGLAGLAARTPKLELRLAGFGVFPGGVLWVAPVVTQALLACHGALHAALPGLECHAHYRPGAWVPHVTLSAQAVAEAALPVVQPMLPVGVGCVLEALELVAFPPVRQLGRFALAAG
ncbi:2'-5' RNA ligase family protein [Siccirubricoccus sp. KC 17139]|uniref:2'-5' RNA ligase family protein n=1 Tax=Siccirubricoccus soli TaxID=2899147 RepID=A0ABT1D9T5_9PROT|nr:2'-5' RNA ligase family protein [Siccirubricoccus soli]MCO6418683.1 2'-5' RNA ligase family protein [Siccirubricoccus soli]MCP2684818.1 2'-5' RNA ligase family protein [Siccirubricoccus soli]